MKWEVVTSNKKHIVQANSSSIAVEQVKQKDQGEIKSVKLAPKDLKGKLRKTWRSWFGK